MAEGKSTGRRRLRVSIVRTVRGLSVCYRGAPEQLIAAGAAEPHMVLPRAAGQPTTDGGRRADSEGDLYYMTRSVKGGWVQVFRCKPIERASKLPGVAEWLAAHPAEAREDYLDLVRAFHESAAPEPSRLH